MRQRFREYWVEEEWVNGGDGDKGEHETAGVVVDGFWATGSDSGDSRWMNEEVYDVLHSSVVCIQIQVRFLAPPFHCRI